MKIILLKDVAKVGKRFEIKNISDGHALNYLIPNGMAETATASTIKRIEVMKAREEVERKIREDLLAKNLGDVDGVSVEMTVKANEKGHLFAAIHQTEIAAAIKTQTGLDINPEFIVSEKPIKEIGDHELAVKVQDKTVKFTLAVKAIQN